MKNHFEPLRHGALLDFLGALLPCGLWLGSLTFARDQINFPSFDNIPRKLLIIPLKT